MHRTNRTGFKAGALAAGLAENHAPIIAMLDADFRPPRNWLRAVVPTLLADPQAGFAQSRCEFANYRSNWLTRAQGLLFDSHFMMEQATRYRAGWLFQFNGTGGIWRREAIDAAGGWSADSLCEDLDLTVRAALSGWHGLFVMEPAVPGLVPEKVSHWQVQQRRWSTGFVQVAQKLLRSVWGAPWTFADKVSASFLILVQAFFPCAAVASLSLIACYLLTGGDFDSYREIVNLIGGLIIAVALGMTLVPYLTLKRGTIWRYLATVVSLPPLLVYVSLSNAPSIVHTLFGRTESFKRTPKTRPNIPVIPPSDDVELPSSGLR
jgi:cellulose synthase/poly-beta-1,6-N-acetylglucosamine synthase-like glycosyltransferase